MSGAMKGAGLLPDHHPTADFFICDIFDAAPKDDLGSMEHPMFSLATRPDRRILSYGHNGTRIEVIPSVKGLATIHDKDILIYCISQLMAALNEGRQIGRRLHLRAHDLLVATNRETSGDAYRRLREAFERLAGTRITTNIETGGHEVTTGFGLIESWQIVRKSRGGRMISVAVTLSDWLFRAVLSKSVLTLSRDYFRLRKPLERRIYELARKHCGRQAGWSVSVDTLLKKSGSASPRRVFRKMLRDMIEADHLPDYVMREEPGDLIRFAPRAGAVPETAPKRPPPLSAEVLEEARARRPGADVHALVAEWEGVWRATGAPRLHAPGRAFLGWLDKRRGQGSGGAG
ncbi:plasmid replication initiator RepA [Oceanicola sp. 22II-s10i]|uniref:replication initiator protein A n=1 Tax=Oceanicola sp. 22II-s10i TaxID=1317116 RepID=UPI000B524DB9|nr:replication initiator protein A [Oceanicola sp. 22II-s10i]OWU81676.1 plasmid replication initiator RepA [Oceanicola sp. 22II-s10i]